MSSLRTRPMVKLGPIDLQTCALTDCDDDYSLDALTIDQDDLSEPIPPLPEMVLLSTLDEALHQKAEALAASINLKDSASVEKFFAIYLNPIRLLSLQMTLSASEADSNDIPGITTRLQESIRSLQVISMAEEHSRVLNSEFTSRPQPYLATQAFLDQVPIFQEEFQGIKELVGGVHSRVERELAVLGRDSDGSSWAAKLFALRAPLAAAQIALTRGQAEAEEARKVAAESDDHKKFAIAYRHALVLHYSLTDELRLLLTFAKRVAKLGAAYSTAATRRVDLLSPLVSRVLGNVEDSLGKVLTALKHAGGGPLLNTPFRELIGAAGEALLVCAELRDADERVSMEIDLYESVLGSLSQRLQFALVAAGGR